MTLTSLAARGLHRKDAPLILVLGRAQLCLNGRVCDVVPSNRGRLRGAIPVGVRVIVRLEDA